MQKTFCDRCGQEIPYGETASMTYSNPGNPFRRGQVLSLMFPEDIQLCQDCARDFNTFMEGRPLREEETDANESTSGP